MKPVLAHTVALLFSLTEFFMGRFFLRSRLRLASFFPSSSGQMLKWVVWYFLASGWFFAVTGAVAAVAAIALLGRDLIT